MRVHVSLRRRAPRSARPWTGRPSRDRAKPTRTQMPIRPWHSADAARARRVARQPREISRRAAKHRTSRYCCRASRLCRFLDPSRYRRDSFADWPSGYASPRPRGVNTISRRVRHRRTRQNKTQMNDGRALRAFRSARAEHGKAASVDVLLDSAARSSASGRRRLLVTGREVAPLVSVITPTFNQARFIADCIGSVKAQTYPNWEMIIIDDGSTDDTAAIVEKHQDSRIHYQRQKHVGILALADTYNRALSNSKGDLVSILEGDDLWTAEKLELLVPKFADPEVV